MLYDQGQLAVVYTHAYQVLHTSMGISYITRLHTCTRISCSQITKVEFFADVVRDILLYVSRDLSDKVFLLSSYRALVSRLCVAPCSASYHKAWSHYFQTNRCPPIVYKLILAVLMDLEQMLLTTFTHSCRMVVSTQLKMQTPTPLTMLATRRRGRSVSGRRRRSILCSLTLCLVVTPPRQWLNSSPTTMEWNPMATWHHTRLVSS